MILSILKGIGILLLILLGLIIFILFVLLFVPICYRMDGKYDQTLNGKVSVTWIPLIFKAKVTFHDNHPEYVIRLLGGVVLTNTDRKISWIGRKIFSKEDDEIQEEKTADRSTEQKEQFATATKNAGELQLRQMQEKETLVASDIKISEKSLKMPPSKKKVGRSNKKKSFYKKLKQKITEQKRKLRDLFLKLKKMKHKKDALEKVLHSKQFKRAKTDLMRYIKDILRIIKPDHIDGYVHFGMEDPATTGQITGVLATIPFVYNESFFFYPDFEKKCLDAEGKGKGKIFLFSIVILRR